MRTADIVSTNQNSIGTKEMGDAVLIALSKRD
jgi:hypothetical protein